MIISILALPPAPTSSSCSSLGLFCFVMELFLTHIPAFTFSLHFLHSQNFEYMHITFLHISVVICSTTHHPHKRTVFCTDAFSSTYTWKAVSCCPLFGLLCPHSIGHTRVVDTRYLLPLHSSLSVCPLHMCISKISSPSPAGGRSAGGHQHSGMSMSLPFLPTFAAGHRYMS